MRIHMACKWSQCHVNLQLFCIIFSLEITTQSAWIAIFTFAEWCSNKNGLTKPYMSWHLKIACLHCVTWWSSTVVVPSMFCPWSTDLLVFNTKSNYLFCHDNSKFKLYQLTNISLWSDLWLWVSMEASELGKDKVFKRDFDCIMFWRYRSII